MQGIVKSVQNSKPVVHVVGHVALHIPDMLWPLCLVIIRILLEKFVRWVVSVVLWAAGALEYGCNESGRYRK